MLQRAWTFARGPYPTLVSLLALGLVFLLAGVGKAIDPAGFARDIRAYQMLPGIAVTVMAYGLPWLEIGLAVYLLSGLYLRWAAAITGTLLVIFMIAMGQALARGLTLTCGCFGAGLGGVALGEEVSVGSILRDAAAAGGAPCRGAKHVDARRAHPREVRAARGAWCGERRATALERYVWHRATARAGRRQTGNERERCAANTAGVRGQERDRAQTALGGRRSVWADPLSAVRVAPAVAPSQR